MRGVLHMIDGTTRPEMLRQLALVGGADERIVSVGPPPSARDLPVAVTAVHCPLGLPPLAGWLHRRLGAGAAVVHSWSPPAARAGHYLAPTGRHVLSLPCAPRGTELRKLAHDLSGGHLALTLPTENARAAVLAAGAPGRSAHVLPPCARPIEDRARRRSATRAALGIAEDEPLLVALGDMVRDAGHKYAPWVHAILKQVLPRVRLVIPGTSALLPHIRRFAATGGYIDDIVFTGERFAEADCLAAADVALLLCPRDAGVGSLAAALAAGLPVVVSATGDVAECTDAGRAARLVAPADVREASAAALALLEDPRQAAELGDRARRFAAERFAAQACLERLEGIYAAGPI